MQSLRQRHQLCEKNRPKLRAYACLPAFLMVLDTFRLEKFDYSFKLYAELSIFSTTIDAADIFQVTLKLFDWLKTIPKDVWVAKEKELEVLL